MQFVHLLIHDLTPPEWHPQVNTAPPLISDGRFVTLQVVMLVSEKPFLCEIVEVTLWMWHLSDCSAEEHTLSGIKHDCHAGHRQRGRSEFQLQMSIKTSSDLNLVEIVQSPFNVVGQEVLQNIYTKWQEKSSAFIIGSGADDKGADAGREQHEHSDSSRSIKDGTECYSRLVDMVTNVGHWLRTSVRLSCAAVWRRLNRLRYNHSIL